METPSRPELGGDLWRHETKWVKTEAAARFWNLTNVTLVEFTTSVHVMRGSKVGGPVGNPG